MAQQRPLQRWLAEHSDDLIAVRRRLHAHPELSGEEHDTTELLAERLRVAGLEPRMLASGTGLLCDIGSSGNGPSRLAFRADLDALAMDDQKDVHYRSQVPGVAHACGHDVHTTVMLGAALYFASHAGELPGPVRFVFQPSEERVPGGALETIADGALDDVAAIVGVHCDPKLDTGSFGIGSGAVSSAADMAAITLTGPGGHTSRPELTVDMISLAARLVRELPERVAAQLADPTAVKVVFGMLRAGDAANVIPARCVIRASVRTPSETVWEQLPDIFDRAMRETIDGTGAGYELDYTHGVPPVVNDAGFTGLVLDAARAELGTDAIRPAVQSWGGDDFAWYLRERPGSYVRMGVHDPTSGTPRLDLHSGSFDVDEAAIGFAVRLMVATTGEFFRQDDRVRPSS